MDEALREVAEKLAARRVDFLRVEADVVRELDELAHQPVSLVGAAGAAERVDEPEGAREERTLALGRPRRAVEEADRRRRARAGFAAAVATKRGIVRRGVGAERQREQRRVCLAVQVRSAHVAARAPRSSPRSRSSRARRRPRAATPTRGPGALPPPPGQRRDRARSSTSPSTARSRAARREPPRSRHRAGARRAPRSRRAPRAAGPPRCRASRSRPRSRAALSSTCP